MVTRFISYFKSVIVFQKKKIKFGNTLRIKTMFEVNKTKKLSLILSLYSFIHLYESFVNAQAIRLKLY
jgi:hypothetical protein